MRTIHKKDSPLDWIGSMPFFVLWAAGVIGPFVTGLSWSAVIVAVFLYYSRMFFVTGFLHRYFSHKSFKTNRFWQFIFACCACTAVQNPPSWWAYHHRHHHLHSDTEQDFHSNLWWGFIESHFFWFLRLNSQKTDWTRIKDLDKPEIRIFENKFVYLMPPTLLAIGCYRLGNFLHQYFPQTNGRQMLMVGFFLSTFCLHNGTFTINSLSHMFGRRRYHETGDGSLNNWFLALFVTNSEGWHNNHHEAQFRVRQGHKWYEIDLTYYFLEVLKFSGIIWNLRYK